MAISKKESTKRVNLNLKGLSEARKTRAKIEAGTIIVEEINSFLDSSESPVKGSKAFEPKADGSSSQLFEDGDMRSQITFSEEESDAIMVGIFGDAPEKERLKGYNHNVGDSLPRRRFIAAPNQVFKKSIMDKVNRSIETIKREEKEEDERIINEVLDSL